MNPVFKHVGIRNEEAKAAASSNWASLQTNAMQALEESDQELQAAADRMDDES